MKTIALLICLVFPNFVFSQDSVSVSRMFSERKLVLEEKYLISFDSMWIPVVYFSQPDSMPDREWKGTLACYDVYSDVFFVNNTDAARVDTSVADHELIHAYVNHLSRRVGFGPWPNSWGFRDSSRFWILGMEMISEGISGYVECFQIPDFPFPDSISFPMWTEEYANIMYWGGITLVKPILDFGFKKGILYLLTHPISFSNGKFKETIEEYQRKAKKVLN